MGISPGPARFGVGRDGSRLFLKTGAVGLVVGERTRSCVVGPGSVCEVVRDETAVGGFVSPRISDEYSQMT